MDDRYQEGRMLREAREGANLTALELAIRCGLTEMRVYAVERGRARLRQHEVQSLAEALGIEPITLAPQWIPPAGSAR